MVPLLTDVLGQGLALGATNHSSTGAAANGAGGAGTAANGGAGAAAGGGNAAMVALQASVVQTLAGTVARPPGLATRMYRRRPLPSPQV